MMKIKKIKIKFTKLLKSILILTIFFVTICLSRKVLMFAFIPSESMENTLKVHDLLYCNRLAYQFNDPERKDIIIFSAPLEEDYYIKRIIGLPGEVISFQDGYVYINGERLEEDYVSEEWETDDVEKTKFIVPKDSYFVMGDNRDFSFDARYWWETALDEGYADSKEEAMSYSFVKRNDIIAKAYIKFFNGFKIY